MSMASCVKLQQFTFVVTDKLICITCPLLSMLSIYIIGCCITFLILFCNSNEIALASSPYFVGRLLDFLISAVMALLWPLTAIAVFVIFLLMF